MEIRPCRAADVPLLDRHIPNPGAPARHADRFARQEAGLGTYLLAWRDGVPVGYGQVRWDGCAAPEVRAVLGDCPELNGLDVWPEGFRGQGIGTALVHAAEALVRERGGTALGLGVAHDNPRAAALYARLGYEAAVTYTDRYGWTDAEGRTHACADACIFLVRSLAVRGG
ncbi:GNAT family N-acetyltransferase [Streptomyces sp. NBC_00094]|uniref:GNAT family N-acetyltransferase n=1 Tax=Streptomyces sp. NBC_00094 TaxID=2903620 RepID=UPI002256B8A8|nr:GNAT family N-acetyltransferase [Streptomyces sp. NBC_00094]MCX5389511.1 GNAT family N-acetyltransferase [Streptomyces sp. NBC_00094]